MQILLLIQSFLKIVFYIIIRSFFFLLLFNTNKKLKQTMQRKVKVYVKEFGNKIYIRYRICSKDEENLKDNLEQMIGNKYALSYAQKVLNKIQGGKIKLSKLKPQTIEYKIDPLILNNLSNLESKLGHQAFILKNYPLNNNQLQSINQQPIVLRKSMLFTEDIQDTRGQLYGLICGIANYRSGEIIICQEFTNSRIQKGLKIITKGLTQYIELKVKTALDKIIGKQDISILAQLIPIVQIKQNKIQEQEQQFVIRMQIRVRPSRNSYGFYIQKKRTNTRNDYQIFRIKRQKKQGQYFWNVKQLLLNYGQCYYEQIKYNIQREYFSMFRWKQQFILGLKINLTHQKYKHKQIQYQVQIELDGKEQQHFCQLCNYFMESYQKDQINQCFGEVPQGYCVVFVNYTEKISLQLVNNIFKGVLNKFKTAYRLINPFSKLQQKVAQLRKEKLNTIQNFCCYYVINSPYNVFCEKIKKILQQQKITDINISQITNKFKIGSSLTQLQMVILEKLCKKMYQVIPTIYKTLNGYKQNSSIQYCKAFQLDDDLSNSQKKIRNYKQVQLIFNQNILQASLFTFFVLYLGKKRPKPSQK